jgi:alkanesulfonate monooxygenase SsuD/methylene tetrahydromethanopterin reductase-like flavin-dependent oxidoreductase (luciferase family)
MELGLASISCQRHPLDPRPPVEIYADALTVAEEAERLGFASIWVSEHHFFDDDYLPSVLPMCAAIAARTNRIEIGTDVLLAPLHDPIRVAEDAAVVDLLAGGRFLFGIGLGWREEEFEGLGLSVASRVPRLERCVRVLREAWSDGLVDGAVPVTPKPARAGGPPIWIGGVVEPAVRRAARLGDGFLASWSTVESFATQVAWIRDELARWDRSPEAFRIAIVHPVFAWHGDDAWDLIREPFWYYVWKYEDMADARGRAGPPPAPPRLSAAREEELRRLAVWGRPDEVAERLRAYEAAAGADVHFVAEPLWPGLDRGVRREAMAILAEEVLPQVTA